MWFVAPVSIIQGALAEFMRRVGWVKDKADAKTECFESGLESWDIFERVPARFILIEVSPWVGISDSLFADEETWLTEDSSSEIEGLSISMSYWHCS